MKHYFLLLTLLFLLTGIYAQSVTVMVSPNRSDWQYKTKEQAVFDVKVYKNNVLLNDVAVDYELGPEFFPTETKKNVVLKSGELTLKSSMKEAGFLRCKVTANVDGRKYDGMATVGYDVDKLLPTTKEPHDFDRFWSEAINDARKMPLDAKTILLPEKCTSTQNVYEVSFQNERAGSRIYGILITPKKQGSYPAILQVPGAGIRPYNGENLGENIITLQIGIHGLPVTLPQEVYTDLGRGALNGYQYFNTNNKDTHYYKRVFLGCVRAIDFIFSLPEFDGKTIGVTGGSQGGALAIVTTALDNRIQFLSAYYPALCDYAGYLNGRAGGWPHYFRNTTPKPNEVETLAYFDVVNFARRVKVKGWYSWGFNDTTCPPTSMHSAYNVISSEKILDIYPPAGHRTFTEQKSAGDNWLKKQCEK